MSQQGGGRPTAPLKIRNCAESDIITTPWIIYHFDINRLKLFFVFNEQSLQYNMFLTYCGF